MNYWINTVSREHVLRGVAGGFTQANHGSPTGLRRLTRGDRIAFYSPKTDYPEGAPLQAFTATGRVTDDEPYQVEMAPDFHPFRRNVEFDECVEAPIRPLLEHSRSSRTRSAGATASGSGFSRSASTTSTRSARR